MSDLTVQIDGLMLIAEHSKTITSLALGIIGGSIAAILGTSYRKPGPKFRKFYFLFIPGWFLAAISIYIGDYLVRSIYSLNIFPGATANIKKFSESISSMNNNYKLQSLFLLLCLTLFIIWLTGYLVWFIFGKEVKNEKKK